MTDRLKDVWVAFDEDIRVWTPSDVLQQPGRLAILETNTSSTERKK